MAVCRHRTVPTRRERLDDPRSHRTQVELRALVAWKIMAGGSGMPNREWAEHPGHLLTRWPAIDGAVRRAFGAVEA